MPSGKRRPAPKRFEVGFYWTCAFLGVAVVVFGLLTPYKDGVVPGAVGALMAVVQIWRIKTDRPDPKWLQPKRDDRGGGGASDGAD